MRSLALSVASLRSRHLSHEWERRRGAAFRATPSPMSDNPPDDAGESPMQRALRLKTAALEARPKPPRGGKFQREQSAGIAAGKSKPWMKQ